MALAIGNKKKCRGRNQGTFLVTTRLTGVLLLLRDLAQTIAQSVWCKTTFMSHTFLAVNLTPPHPITKSNYQLIIKFNNY